MVKSLNTIELVTIWELRNIHIKIQLGKLYMKNNILKIRMYTYLVTSLGLDKPMRIYVRVDRLGCVWIITHHCGSRDDLTYNNIKVTGKAK